MTYSAARWLAPVAIAAAFIAAGPAQAAAVHDAGLFTGNTLAANDDGSTGLVNLGFSVNINGSTYTQTYVNNNGNVTFDGAMGTFTPAAINAGGFGPIIAPFFADVDTRGTGSGLVQYGTATLGGHNVFGVNWINVGYYSGRTDKLNSFQLILIDRSDISAGDFDIEFNYDAIRWETGEASGGTGGLGGVSALAGYWTSSSSNATLAGSLVNGALLDSGVNALIADSLNSNTSGQYVFNVRNGAVQPPSGTVPEPASVALLGTAFAGLALMRRRRRA